MWYKIFWGYDDERAIPISTKELEKAFYCHLRGITGAFEHGSISGDKIIAIQPDYHRIMGWNTGYKLNALDYEELDQKGIREVCNKELQTAKEKAQFRLSTGKEMPPKIESPEVRYLAEKMRIK